MPSCWMPSSWTLKDLGVNVLKKGNMISMLEDEGNEEH